MNDDPAIFCSLTVFIGARYWSWYRSVPPTNQSPRIHMSTCSYNFVFQVWLFLHWERWSAGPQPHTGDGGGCQGRRGRGQLGGDYQVRLISISYKWEINTSRPQHFSICWCVMDVDNLHYRWDTAWRTWLSIGQKNRRWPWWGLKSSAPSQVLLTALFHIFPLLHHWVVNPMGGAT